MVSDRIVELQVQGMRSLQDVRLPVRPGLTVLIGENGAGKSSLLEAVELLGKTLGAPNFLEAFNDEHGGIHALLRQGASSLSIGLRVEGDGPPLEYGFRLAKRGHFAVIDGEWLKIQASDAGEARDVIRREGDSADVFEQDRGARSLRDPRLVDREGAVGAEPAARAGHRATGDSTRSPRREPGQLLLRAGERWRR